MCARLQSRWKTAGGWQNGRNRKCMVCIIWYGGKKYICRRSDGKSIIVAVDNDIEFWNIASQNEEPIKIRWRTQIDSFALSPDGHLIAISDAEGVNILNIDSMRKTQIDAKLHLKKALSFSPDGTLLGVGDVNGIISLWRTSDGVKQNEIEAHQGAISSIAFSPDGKSIASSDEEDNMINIWNLSDLEIKLTLPTIHANEVGEIVFNLDGSLFMEAVEEGIKIWSTESGQIVQDLNGLISAIFSSDGRAIANLGDTKTKRIKLISSTTGDLLLTIDGEEPIAFSTDGNLLAYTQRLEKNKTQINIWDVSTNQFSQTLFGHAGYISQLAFSPDGRQLASGGTNEGKHAVIIWSVETEVPLYIFPIQMDFVRQVAFSPDGKLFAFTDKSGGNGPECCFAQIHIISRETNKLKYLIDGYIEFFAFNSTGETIWGIDNGLIRKWEAATGKILQTLDDPYGNRYTSLAIDPKRNILMAAINDTLLILDSDEGKEIARITSFGKSQWLAQAPDGRFDISVGGKKYIRWRVGDTLYGPETYFEKYYRPGLLSEIFNNHNQASSNGVY